MKNVAVIGAAGFVGQFLVDILNKAGIKPTTVTRANGLLLLSRKNVDSILVEDVEKLNKKFDVVINLAVPLGGRKYLLNKKSDEIVNLIEKLSDSKTKIIHTSSLAVFGYTLQHPIKAEPIKKRHDWDYVEGKISVENQLIKKFKSNEVHIVRLGNVWGAASPNWTVSLINNVLYGQPTAIYQKDGFSNVTDVNNAVDYLKFLTLNSSSVGVHIHHLAEFYDVKWSFWLQKFSDLFGMPVKYVYNVSGEAETTNIFQDFKAEFMPVPLKHRLKGLYKTKVAGSYLRSLVSRLPERLLQRAENVNDTIFIDSVEEVEDPTFFKIMAGTVPFENKTLSGWVPPLSTEDSWTEIKKWIEEIKLHY